MPAPVLYDEKSVLQRIAEGDEQAFNQLFNRYWDKLYGYLFSITKSREIAEEIASDVFLKLWTGRALIADIRRIDGFLFRVAHNKAMDFFKLAAKSRKLQKIIEEAMERRPSPAADHDLLDAEANRVWEEAVAALSPRRRLIFTLSRVEGLDNDEIAARLNLSRHTVKNTIADSIHIISSFLRKKEVSGLVVLWILLR